PDRQKRVDMNMSIHRLTERNMTRLCIGLCALFLVATPVAGQERFANPQAAVEVLVAAARAGDRNRVLGIFGPQGRDIIDSGDQVADKNARENFLSAYDTANRIDQEGDDRVTLVIGREEWPFPIPLVLAGGSWQFDVAAGRQEILARRIGGNE